jgi:glycerophosphoryl diester phosphodiesterase
VVRQFSVIGHRGAAGYRPENTIASYARAIELGCDKIELDVHPSRDGVLFCHHDSVLNPECVRLQGRYVYSSGEFERRLSRLDSARLEQLDVGVPRPKSKYKFKRPLLVPQEAQSIPKLKDALYFVAQASERLEVVIEIKLALSASAEAPIVKDLSSKVCEAVRSANLVDRTIVCGFHWETTAGVRALEPSIRTWHSSGEAERLLNLLEQRKLRGTRVQTAAALKMLHGAGNAPWFGGYDPRRYGGSYPEAIAAAGGSGWFSRHNLLDRRSVDAAHQRGLTVAAWTVNEQSDINRVAGMGVDAICSDYPDRLVHINEGRERG